MTITDQDFEQDYRAAQEEESDELRVVVEFTCVLALGVALWVVVVVAAVRGMLNL